MFMINFKKNYSSLKRQLGYTIKEIAQATGIKNGTLNQYEFFSSLPSYERLKKIVDFFGVSIDYILLKSNNKFINYNRLFYLAVKTNELPSMQRNHIEDSVAQFINRNQKSETIFDNTDRYQLTNSIHKNLKKIRDLNNISQNEIAQILDFKSRKSISNIESGSSRIPYNALLKLSSTYNISMHFLITGEALNYNIQDNFLYKNLIIFDKNATSEQINVVTILMQQILRNNNIPF